MTNSVLAECNRRGGGGGGGVTYIYKHSYSIGCVNMSNKQ